MNELMQPSSGLVDDKSVNLLSGRSKPNQQAGFTEALLSSRQNISPRRLVEPGPGSDQIEKIFRAAATAPDHGLLMPWRIICIGEDQRAALAKAFVLALLDRDPGATGEQLEAAHEKAFRAPFLALAVSRLGPESAGIRTIEQIISLGCAVQNILLSAHAMGFGSGLTSGRAITSQPLRSLFELAPNEEAACFIAIGTVSKPKPVRQRPQTQSFVSHLAATAMPSTSLT